MKINREWFERVSVTHDPWQLIALFIAYKNPELRTLDDGEIQLLVDTGLLVADYLTGTYECVDTLFEQEFEDESFKLFVDDYRNLFSKSSVPQWAYRPGIMGDKKMVEKKLKVFLKTEKCTKQQVLDAVKYYVSKIADGSIKYVHDADNFISKNGRSALRAIIEDAGDDYKPYENDTIL